MSTQQTKRWRMRKGILLFGLFLISIPSLLSAQQYPTKPINIIISYAPGGSVDITTRALLSKAEKFLGQPIVISNQGGGGGTVALGIVAKQRPDGYSLVAITSPPLILIPQYRPVTYKHEDFVPIMHFARMQTGLVVKADSPWKTLKEFVEYAKMNPGKVTYASTGVGTMVHLAMEYISRQEGGIQWTHIPYQGTAPALPALLGGHITALSSDTIWIPHVKEGTLRLLATHGEKRLETFPNVPTFRELGYNFVNEALFLVAAPKGTSPSIIKMLDETFRKCMDDPEFIQSLRILDYEITYRNSEDTKRYLEDAYIRLGKMITDFKIPKQLEKKQ